MPELSSAVFLKRYYQNPLYQLFQPTINTLHQHQNIERLKNITRKPKLTKPLSVLIKEHTAVARKRYV